MDSTESLIPSLRHGPVADLGVTDAGLTDGGATDAARAGPGGRDGRQEPAFDPVLVGIGVLDLDGRTTSTNEVLRDSLGYSGSEFAASAFSTFIHSDDVTAHLDRFAQLVGGLVERFATDERFICRDGGTLWVAHTVSLVRDADGNPHHAISVTQDVTAHRIFVTDPCAVEQRSQLQVERVPAIVYVAEPGPQGRWLYVSPQIESLLGFTAREWMADPGLWMQLLHPDDQQSRRLAASALATEADLLTQGAEDKFHSDTYRLRHRNGSTVWVRDDAIVLWDAEGHATRHGVLVDLTRETHGQLLDGDLLSPPCVASDVPAAIVLVSRGPAGAGFDGGGAVSRPGRPVGPWRVPRCDLDTLRRNSGVRSRVEPDQPELVW